jgi:hypothetical protein
MGRFEEYKMFGVSLEQWGNQLLDNFYITIEEISESGEIDNFWNGIRSFYENGDEKGAMDWIAQKFEGYDSYDEIEEEQANEYAYEKAMNKPE